MQLTKDARLDEIAIGSHQRCNILMAIPTIGMVPIEFAFAFMRMQMPINGQVFQFVVKGHEVGVARNLAVEHIMNMPQAERPKYLFFIGDDMIPDWDGFVKLYEEAERNQWDCLTGLYFWKGEPPTALIWRNDHVGRLLSGEHFDVGDVIHADLTGLDFTLIRVSMLEKIDSPWFKTGPSKRSRVPSVIEPYLERESIVMHTEDVWFYNKVKELGGTIGVHTGVRVGHLDVKTGCVY